MPKASRTTGRTTPTSVIVPVIRPERNNTLFTPPKYYITHTQQKARVCIIMDRKFIFCSIWLTLVCHRSPLLLLHSHAHPRMVVTCHDHRLHHASNYRPSCHQNRTSCGLLLRVPRGPNHQIPLHLPLYHWLCPLEEAGSEESKGKEKQQYSARIHCKGDTYQHMDN